MKRSTERAKKKHRSKLKTFHPQLRKTVFARVYNAIDVFELCFGVVLRHQPNLI